MLYTLDKGLIDLEPVYGEFTQIAEIGITSAKIIYRQLDAECMQAAQGAHHSIGILHKHTFGQLQLQERRRDASFLNNAFHHAAEIALVKLHGGDIHRDTHGLQPIFYPGFMLAASLVNDPLTDGNNQPGFLGNFNKVYRRQ